MKRYLLLGLLGMLFAAAIWTVFPIAAYAGLPYMTYSEDAAGRYAPSPHGFVPSRIIDGFRNPEHVFIASDDQLYVADTGNNRIVQMDREGRIVRSIPDSGEHKEPDEKEKLRKPEGVFVTEDGLIYVADTGSNRIAVFDKSGSLIREYLQPNSSFTPSNYMYVPSQVALDRRGYVYVANKGGYQGLLQLTPDGQFAGFFGANKVASSPLDRLKRKYYTKEQLAEEQKKLPGAVTNMAVDRRGFLYTVSRGMNKGQLKRLNSGGSDLLNDKNFTPPWAKRKGTFSFQSVAVDADGGMTALEADGGRIYQYDGEGNLLFVFGSEYSNDPRFGLFKRATGVAVDSEGSIYVADGELGVIQVFKRTEFGELVQSAAKLSEDGRHEEAYTLWERILSHDGTFDRAYRGMANAEMKRGNFSESMGLYKLALDRQGYSDSFWQVRLDRMTRYFAPVILSAAVIFASLSLIKRLLRRRRKGPASDMHLTRVLSPWNDPGLPSWRYAWSMTILIIRRPVNSLYELAQTSSVPPAFAALLVIAGMAVKIGGLAATSFLFEERPFSDINPVSEALTFAMLWFGWVLANYMTGTIMKGEGTFRRVFIVNAYALVPYILFTIPLRLLSAVLTLQESGIYNALLAIVGIWTFVLIFTASQMVHNYNLKEVIGMNAVSLLTLACFALFGFVIVGLMVQAADFFIELGRELIDRV